MITEPKKHRTRVSGVSVTVNPSGSFTVTATAAAVKRWPWDGTSWPCANLYRAHRFTFEAAGDLADIETSQADSRDGANGEAVSALANDCRTLAAEVKARLETPPPPPCFKLWTRGDRGRYFATLEAAKAAAEAVREQTGIFLLITEEKRRK